MPKKHITIPVFVPHSGCPHQCVFCNQCRVTSVKRTPVTTEIRELIERHLYHIPSSVKKIEAAFFGGSFTGIPVNEQIYLLEAVKPYLEKGLIHAVRISTRPDYISKEKLDLLKYYKVETVELGVQSFDNRVLQAAGRGHSAEDVFAAMELLKKYGLRSGIQLMTGLPGDSFRISSISAETAASLSPDDARIYPVLVLKDTPLEIKFRSGEYKPLTLEDAVESASSMYRILKTKSINVIRIGLHPMDMESGSVIAGPYHPAMGFLVKSRCRRDELDTVLTEAGFSPQDRDGVVNLVLPDRYAEEYIGMKKVNIHYLIKKYQLKSLKYSIRETEKPFIDP